jgi:hypothetical protein
MRESRPRPRSVAVLVFAAIVAIAGTMSPNQAGARLSATYSKDCYYANQVYSMGACRGPQRCVRGVNSEDYWQDDTTCDQTSPGSGGRRQV